MIHPVAPLVVSDSFPQTYCIPLLCTKVTIGSGIAFLPAFVQIQMFYLKFEYRYVLLWSWAGIKAWRRSRFAATVRLLTDLDEDGLKYVMKNLPSWVKVSISLCSLCRCIALLSCVSLSSSIQYMTDYSPVLVPSQFSDYERAKYVTLHRPEVSPEHLAYFVQQHLDCPDFNLTNTMICRTGSSMTPFRCCGLHLTQPSASESLWRTPYTGDFCVHAVPLIMNWLLMAIYLH